MLGCGPAALKAEEAHYSANLAQVRQSRLDSGFGFRIRALNFIHVVPSSLGSGLNALTKRGRQYAANLAQLRQSKPDSGLVFQMFSFRSVADPLS